MFGNSNQNSLFGNNGSSNFNTPSALFGIGNTSTALTAFGNPSSHGGPSNTSLFSMGNRETPSLFGGGRMTYSPSLFGSNRLKTPVTIYVTDPSHRSIVDNALLRSGDISYDYTVLSAPLPPHPSSAEEFYLPDADGKKQVVFRLSGVDQGTIRVELDSTSRRTLRITAEVHPAFRQLGSDNAFCFTKVAPPNMQYCIVSSDIELIGGMLLIRYTLQSSMNFETIFEGKQ